MLGLHYFFHPAKNRLVEVIAGEKTDAGLLRRAWRLQEALGKTPIASRDSYGFIVNRFFLPWLTEAVRIVEEGLASAATVDEAAKKAFGIGMGPFLLMNVTGVPIALHAATTLGRAFGPMYEAPPLLRTQAESGQPWEIAGTPDPAQFREVGDRLMAAACYVAAALVDENVGTIEDTDIGARVGLRWRRGPFELMNHLGIDRASDLAAGYAHRWNAGLPATLVDQARTERPFRFSLVRTQVANGIATLTINRPDAMNALNEEVVAQFEDAFRAAAGDPGVTGIVIAGSGKAFVAGADIRFFVRNIESENLDRIAAFTERGQALLRTIETSKKPVVARVHGLALGGGVELALACHAIVATPKASLAFPETGIGIYPGLGGTQRTTKRVGRGLAKWLVLTGQTIAAGEALAIGLIDKVVPYEQLDDAIAEMIAAGTPTGHGPRPVPATHAGIAAFFESHEVETLRTKGAPEGSDERIVKAVKRIGSKAPIALRLAESLIDRGADLPIQDGLRLELSHVREIFSTRDAYEGLSSLGKKAPCSRDVRRLSASNACHQPHQGVLARVGAGQLADDAPRAKDEDAGREVEHLGHLARDQHDGTACGGELVDERVNLRLGADVDAARRLVEDQHGASRGEPLRQHDLLLVAARQRGGRRVEPRRLDPEALEERLRPPAVRPRP